MTGGPVFSHKGGNFAPVAEQGSPAYGRLRRVLRWVVAAYAALGILIYHFQDRLFFRPVPLAPDHRYDFGIPHRERNLRFSEGAVIHIVEFPAPVESRRGIVLYYHGNRRNISWYARHVGGFHRNGYDVWMIDYPGYGKSTGPLEVDVLFAYALQMYRLARTQAPPDSIVIYGRSMGTGIAAWLASREPAGRLILETPYYSLASLGAAYLPVYPWERMIRHRIRTHEYLREVKAPVTVFQGTDDWTVPMRNASRLKPFLKPGDEFVTIEGGGHNDLESFPAFRRKMDSLLSR